MFDRMGFPISGGRIVIIVAITMFKVLSANESIMYTPFIQYFFLVTLHSFYIEYSVGKMTVASAIDIPGYIY